MTDPQETVARLIKQREEETPEGGELQLPKPPTTETLTETEALTLENLQLKREIYLQRLNELERGMGELANRVRDRLDIDERYELKFNTDRPVVMIRQVQE